MLECLKYRLIMNHPVNHHQQTVTRDIQWLKSAAKKEISEKLEKKFPGEYHRYSVAIEEVVRLAWDFALIEKLIRPERLHLNL